MAAYYTFQDLSGQTTSSATSDNPYDGLIESCHNDPAEIQSRYNLHRTNRNAQQREKILASDFPGVTIDEILAKIENPTLEPGYKDWRHCLVFWARPPQRIRSLIGEVQRRLLKVAPSTWLMPSECLHMTALEVVHSLTMPEIDSLVGKMLPFIPEITDYTLQHRARLVKPLVSFDAQALALSFLPAAGEPRGTQPGEEGDEYTYHHLRRDLHANATATGVKVASRYVIPSAHLTIARFITKRDFETAEGRVDREKVARFVRRIEEINEWLMGAYWPTTPTETRKGTAGLEWIVGEEKGLDCRKGALWYGGGETVRLGEGF